MWKAFELMHKTFKSGAELYLEGQSQRNRSHHDYLLAKMSVKTSGM